MSKNNVAGSHIIKGFVYKEEEDLKINSKCYRKPVQGS